MINVKLEKIEELYGELYKNLVDTVLVSLGNTRPSRDKTDNRYLLRDSMTYRMKSINYHLNLMIKRNNEILIKLRGNPFQFSEMEMMSAQNEFMYLFDDLVFNVSSIFDYFGGLIGCLYVDIDKHKIKWKGCERACAKDDNQMSTYKIAELVTSENRAWIQQLFEYRSKLIHFHKDNVTSSKQLTFNSNGFTSVFKVDRPDVFLKLMKQYSRVDADENDGVIDVAVWLVNKSYNTINDLLIIAKEEIKH